MAAIGILLAILSGICNGLFATPMKLESRWKWENIWFVFILVACLAMPSGFVFISVPEWRTVFSAAPTQAVLSAIFFGFAWGFGAICFGRSVDRLGVSIANTLVIGLSSALGSLVPLLVAGALRFDLREMALFIGILSFLIAGVMSAVFNIGYSLALPIADAGIQIGYSRFTATNCIWLLMLAAGSIPNIIYCLLLMRRNKTAKLIFSPSSPRAWGLSIAMGLLWGGSIFLYGAATPRLGDIGPSIGWPLSLAVGLLVANLMGALLGEWRGVSPTATRKMNLGISTLLFAIVMCAISTRVSG
jgi:L-rhamnose-H+ transport protein